MPSNHPHLVPPRDGRQSEPALAVQRGVGRLFRQQNFSVLTELPLATGRRADVVGLGPAGELWIVEIKSSIEDFRTDAKWPDYRLSCDRFLFATHSGVPLDIFPEDAGLILADGFGAEIMRHAPEHRLTGATRKAMLLRFGQAAANRFHDLLDPDLTGFT